MWEVVQEVLDAINASADTLGHKTLPLSVLRQTLSPEIRHEEAHVHPHRFVPIKISLIIHSIAGAVSSLTETLIKPVNLWSLHSSRARGEGRKSGMK